MEEVSRRMFVKRASLGAVAVGALAATPLAWAETKSHASSPEPDLSGISGPVVAHVRDLGKGLVDVFVGTRLVTVTDRELAKSLTRIAAV
ncbi:MAG TPA: twin-arginine translocation signal domain-containing protein [Mycobacteriales bacterium]|jgi:hypothetical protein|nr:twin-arginine translocation signal domain-containing protein [Mycobacteriales bacterium]